MQPANDPLPPSVWPYPRPEFSFATHPVKAQPKAETNPSTLFRLLTHETMLALSLTVMPVPLLPVALHDSTMHRSPATMPLSPQ